MAFIDGTALNVALPALQADLGATGAQLLWIVNGYLLMLAALILVGGSLGDRLGRKAVFMTGIVIFLVASFACGLAPTTEVLIGARVLQGLGGALMIPGSLAIIGASFGPDQRGRAIGAWSAVTTLVTIAGPVLGGILADYGLWRGVFLLNLPLGIAALVILALRVRESRDDEAPRAIDYPGAILVSVGLAGVTYGCLTAPEAGLTDPSVLVTLIGGAVALGLFVLVEARSSSPMLPLSLFRSRTFSGANLLTLLLYGALAVGTFFLSLNLVQAQGYPASAAGLAFLPFALLLAVLSRLTGGLADRYGPRLPLMVGPALVSVGFGLLALVGLTGGPSNYWWTFFPGIIVFGLGMAITVAPLTAAVMGAVAGHAAGTASGVNNAVSRTAGVLAIAIVGAAALVIFAGALEARTAGLGLPTAAQAELRSASAQLGATPVPADVPPGQVDAVQLAIRQAMVTTYQMVMLACAVLAALSAAAAAWLIERGGAIWVSAPDDF
jgi:EmrB/QacA subfamily drug resistance transporter